MTTLYEKIKDYLEVEPKARERAQKNRAIGNLMLAKYTPDFGLSKEKMSDMVGEILSADRAWRKVLEENEHLRGTDYGEKEDLEIIKQRELGYNV